MDKNTKKLLSDVNLAIIKIRSAYNAWTRKNNLNYFEMMIFYTMADIENCTQKTIYESYMLPKQSVNNVVTRLKNQGYIFLEPSPDSQREKILRFTPEGKEYAKKMMQPLSEIEEESVLEMGREKIDMMTRLADEYGEILQKLVINDEKSENKDEQ